MVKIEVSVNDNEIIWIENLDPTIKLEWRKLNRELNFIFTITKNTRKFLGNITDNNQVLMNIGKKYFDYTSQYIDFYLDSSTNFIHWNRLFDSGITFNQIYISCTYIYINESANVDDSGIDEMNFSTYYNTTSNDYNNDNGYIMHNIIFDKMKKIKQSYESMIYDYTEGYFTFYFTLWLDNDSADSGCVPLSIKFDNDYNKIAYTKNERLLIPYE